METYELVRRQVLVHGQSIRSTAREFGIDRRTAKKMVERPVPAGYRLSKDRARPKMAGFEERIAEMLAADGEAPAKQRHTGKRIYERLRKEHGYSGGPCQVRREIAKIKGLKAREAYVPLVSVPGEAECDFGEAVVEIGGVRQKARGFHLTLPFSGVSLLQMYPAENSESFVDGHVRAFRFFGGVPSRIVYDNPAYAVKIKGKLTGRERELASAFSELRSRALFEAAFCNPASGNEKGSVERRVGQLRKDWLVPVPKASSFEELNRVLFEKALVLKEEKKEAFQTDALKLLPPVDYEPARLVKVKSDKLSLIRFETCSYSVPTKYAQRELLVSAGPLELKISSGHETIAVHARSYEKGRAFAKLEHYIDLLERKPRAAKCALPVIQAGLPHVFEAFRRKVSDGTGAGDLRFVGVLRLVTEFGAERIANALESHPHVREAADIRLLVLKEAEKPSSSVCMDWKDPQKRTPPRVERPPLSQYAALLPGAAR